MNTIDEKLALILLSILTKSCIRFGKYVHSTDLDIGTIRSLYDGELPYVLVSDNYFQSSIIIGALIGYDNDIHCENDSVINNYGTIWYSGKPVYWYNSTTTWADIDKSMINEYWLYNKLNIHESSDVIKDSCIF